MAGPEFFQTGMGRPDRRSATKDALLAFVSTIEATGGVKLDWHHVPPRAYPLCDEERIDLGEAYIKACGALRREPKVAEHIVKQSPESRWSANA